MATWMLSTVAVAAAQPLTLDPATGQVGLADRGEYWYDRSGQVTVDTTTQVSETEWRQTRTDRIYRVRGGTALWVRFQLAEPDDSQRWYLEVPYSGVDRVTLYAQDKAGRWVPRSAGDQIPVASWPVPHRHPVLPLALTPGAAQQFYVRIENPHTFGAPFVFISERELLRQEQRTALILGIYFGLAGLSVMLALVAAMSTRDTAFLWYGLTVTLMGLAQASVTGVAGLHLWPEWAWWNDAATLVLPVTSLGVLLWLLSAVVSLPQRLMRLHRLLSILSLICLLCAATILLVDTAWRVRLMVPTMLLGIACAMGVVAWAATRGDRYAGWLMAGMVPLAVGSAFPLSRAAGLLPVGFWTTHGAQLGIAIALPVMLTVLFARSQDRRENIRRIHGLGRIDPATGLINGDVFLERLRRLIARSKRLHHQSVVLLLDIANIGQIERNFDRRSAEEMPLQVAGRLLSSARDIDSVARLSDHRFGILIEGPVTPDDAAAAGAKVVARCLMPFDGKPLEWVAQVRVAQTLVPGPGAAEEVLEKLEGLLASIPPDSKRAVFTLK
ncbi:MAG TPA: 7TM diverse intracellular signaling domain-containing protein [Ramlibacter sp.]|nr:7TM diverse intracellular signaling domain-containing protein [Ramlibacter sp.]HZY17668.1 7TM diverse intracellular signaling domain-containing protein [Ramlibacter sp.]